MELRRKAVPAPEGVWGSASAAALFIWRADALPACAQDNVVGIATLPRDLSPWGMFLSEAKARPISTAFTTGPALSLE